MMGILEELEVLEVRGRCASCHWWQKYPAPAYAGEHLRKTFNGECRRRSPLCSENEALLFPVTHQNCWCGDYAAAAGRSAADAEGVEKTQEASDG